VQYRGLIGPADDNDCRGLIRLYGLNGRAAYWVLLNGCADHPSIHVKFHFTSRYGPHSTHESGAQRAFDKGRKATVRTPDRVLLDGHHQVARSVVRKEFGLKQHDGVVVVKSVDGLGPPGPKINTYRVVNKATPTFVHAGFKLFFTEDSADGGRLMTPKEVVALKPRPKYVMYE
jgi:hypothetical protein